MNYNSPDQVAEAFSNAAVYRSKLPLGKFAALAVLGGAFIGFSGALTVAVAGGMPDAAPGLVKLAAGLLFPAGLVMVSVAGADLFTSDCAIMVFPGVARKTAALTLLRVLVLAYAGNFLGAQLVCALTAGTGMFDAEPWNGYLRTLAEAKTSAGFGKVFLKGIAANWLVCLGTWMGYAGRDVVGKAVGIWIPVALFVTLGYEHSIANMFFIPAAIYSGGEITWATFVSANLIPSTLGNIVGGALMVGAVYRFVYFDRKRARN